MVSVSCVETIMSEHQMKIVITCRSPIYLGLLKLVPNHNVFAGNPCSRRAAALDLMGIVVTFYASLTLLSLDLDLNMGCLMQHCQLLATSIYAFNMYLSKTLCFAEECACATCTGQTLTVLMAQAPGTNAADLTSLMSVCWCDYENMLKLSGL